MADFQTCEDVMVRIIIVSYNSHQYMSRCLDALEQQTLQNFEVVVVDNASQDEGPHTAIARYGKAKLLQMTTNLGFVKACNIGAQGHKPNGYAV